MNIFHIMTIVIASVIFISLFIYTAVNYYSSRNKAFPPNIARCPDYWKTDANGTCKIPAVGSLNLGNLASKTKAVYKYDNIDKIPNYSYLPQYYDVATGKKYQGKKTPYVGYFISDIPHGYNPDKPVNATVDFKHMGWASFGDPQCEIKKWAKIQNVQWDGLNSYNRC